MSSILNTAISGINAMKAMIDNTVNKINHTRRNNVEKHVVLENITSKSFLNNTAVKVKEIYDNYNDFITEEKRKTSAQVADERTNVEQLLKLETLLNEKSIIFNQLVNNLYEQIHTEIVLNKQNIINKNIKEQLKNIIFSFQDFDRKLKFLEKDIKNQVIQDVQQANYLIDQIHDINVELHYFGQFEEPNKVEILIDKRDQLVDDLNNLIGIKVIKSKENYKICLNNGMCIIDNDKKQNLISLTSNSDNGYISIGYLDNSDNQVKKIEDSAPQASLGALLRFRREDLNNTKNKIGQLAVNFADSINEHHALGYDMFGNIGKQIFHVSDPENISSSNNRSSTKISSKWISSSDAKDTDYVIYFKNNNWIVARLSDRTMVQTNIRQDNNGVDLIFDGIEFSLEGKSSDGDIYMIKPYSKTLEKLELLIDEKTPFAFSSINEPNYPNRNNAMTINRLNQDFLVDQNETLDQSYKKFYKSVSNKCNTLEESLPFKANMIRILDNKKISMSNDVEKDFQELNYEQDCYLANVKVLQTAESIFNEIVDCYS